MAQIVLVNSYGGNQVHYNESLAWYSQGQVRSQGPESIQAASVLKKIGKCPYALQVYVIAESLHRAGHTIIEQDDNGTQKLFTP